MSQPRKMWISRKWAVRRVQELRRSNAAQPIPSGKRYRRRPKHRPMVDMNQRGQEQ